MVFIKNCSSCRSHVFYKIAVSKILLKSKENPCDGDLAIVNVWTAKATVLNKVPIAIVLLLI